MTNPITATLIEATEKLREACEILGRHRIAFQIGDEPVGVDELIDTVNGVRRELECVLIQAHELSAHTDLSMVSCEPACPHGVH